jgi:hypothetical protein
LVNNHLVVMKPEYVLPLMPIIEAQTHKLLAPCYNRHSRDLAHPTIADLVEWDKSTPAESVIRAIGGIIASPSHPHSGNRHSHPPVP